MVFEPRSQLGHKKIKYSSPPAFHIAICTVPDCPVSDMLMQFRKLAGSHRCGKIPVIFEKNSKLFSNLKMQKKN